MIGSDPFLRNHQCRRDFNPFQINIQNRTCLSQGTGHSEHPHYSIKLCVDDNGRWEKTIHNILTIRGKKQILQGMSGLIQTLKKYLR